jgi:hypothetical protein
LSVLAVACSPSFCGASAAVLRFDASVVVVAAGGASSSSLSSLVVNSLRVLAVAYPSGFRGASTALLPFDDSVVVVAAGRASSPSLSSLVVDSFSPAESLRAVAWPVFQNGKTSDPPLAFESPIGAFAGTGIGGSPFLSTPWSGGAVRASSLSSMHSSALPVSGGALVLIRRCC